MRAMSTVNPAGFAPRRTLSRQIRSLVTAVSPSGQLRTDGVHASLAEFLHIPDSRTELTRPNQEVAGRTVTFLDSPTLHTTRNTAT